MTGRDQDQTDIISNCISEALMFSACSPFFSFSSRRGSNSLKAQEILLNNQCTCGSAAASTLLWHIGFGGVRIFLTCGLWPSSYWSDWQHFNRVNACSPYYLPTMARVFY
jgi:hypothetical protein